MAGQTEIIWTDPQKQGWKSKTSYRVFIEHRPKEGIIRLKIYEGSVKIIDSGDVIDTGPLKLSGGRVGVFTCSQPKTIWSDMKYSCHEEWNAIRESQLLFKSEFLSPFSFYLKMIRQDNYVRYTIFIIELHNMYRFFFLSESQNR